MVAERGLDGVRQRQTRDRVIGPERVLRRAKRLLYPEPRALPPETLLQGRDPEERTQEVFRLPRSREHSTREYERGLRSPGCVEEVRDRGQTARVRVALRAPRSAHRSSSADSTAASPTTRHAASGCTSESQASAKAAMYAGSANRARASSTRSADRRCAAPCFST